MELSLYSQAKLEATDKLAVNETVFGRDYNEALIHQVVTAHMACGRATPRAKRNRANVRGGGIKPWKQKGTGRARAGSIRSPLWVGGGVTFGGQIANFKQKVNKKMYRGAVRAILSELNRQERLIVIDQLVMETAKTKNLIDLLAKLNCHAS